MPSPDVSSYYIGIVCALPKELAAILAILDEEYDRPKERLSQDDNTYVLGRVRQHNVVVACLPAGNYGTESTATVANNLTRTFPRVKMGLMVGIGGGIPNLPEHDIRLGDVVISQPDGEHGGVVQYDLGKKLGDGIFKRKGSLNQPPKALLTALSLSQAKHAGISSYLQEAYSKHPTLLQRGYGSPGVAHDHLYSINGEVLRENRMHQDPVIHYGTIASGNSVIKDTAFRNQLGRELGAKCVEMEAAGLMNNFPSIVIRGICDYADSHKNDKWQEYASLTAAACAKELLTWLAPQKADISRLYVNEDLMNCHRAFKTTSYETFKNINPERSPNTCLWTLKHEAFRCWSTNAKNDLLWISADPGCGKSVLARSLIDTDLHQEQRMDVCYFFFKDNEDQNNLSAALCSLLHQIFTFAPHLTHHAFSAWQRNGEPQKIELPELWRIFMQCTEDSESPSIVCVLDALDECQKSDRNILIHNLIKFYEQTISLTTSSYNKSRQHYIKFLVTSRPYGDIEDVFDLPSIRLRGEDESKQIHEEIDMVIRQRVARLNLGQQIKDRIETQLLKMEHHTYLWLYLAFESMNTVFKRSSRPEEESIESLPTGVDDAYEKILSKASKNKQDLMLILQIIVGAKRPLTIGEMAIALGVATCSKATASLETLRLDDRHLEKQIRDWCGLFVFCSDSKIYLIHQTAKEFLIRSPGLVAVEGRWKYSLVPADVESVLAQICVSVLLFCDVAESLPSFTLKSSDMVLEQGYPILKGELVDREKDCYSFVTYSAIEWTSHLSKTSSPLNLVLKSMVLQLYNTSRAHFEWWFRIYWQANYYGRPPLMNSLCLAAHNGHKEIIQELLKDNLYEIDQRDGHRNTALIWASQSGHLEIVKLALERGADVNALGLLGTALQAACGGNHFAVVELLLYKGAIDTLSLAFCSAAKSGHLAIVELLLSRLHASKSSSSEIIYPAGVLEAAIRGGHEVVVELLLNRGIAVCGDDLYAASREGSADMLELLLSKGANFDAKGRSGTALEAATKFHTGCLDIVTKLLSKNAEISATAIYNAVLSGNIALIDLVLHPSYEAELDGGELSGALVLVIEQRGDVQMAELLLDRGATINMCALVEAAYQEGAEISKLLLSRAASVNTVPEHIPETWEQHCNTALELASAGGHLALVEALLKCGARLSVQAFTVALYRGHIPITELLLTKSVNVNAVQPCDYVLGWTALEVASDRRYMAIIETLLSKGAKPSADSLVLASSNGYVNVIELLLDYGADVNASFQRESDIDLHGYTALGAASKYGHKAAVELLLSRGADSSVEALVLASREGYANVVKMLIDKGADVNANFGGEETAEFLYYTPLDAASEGGNIAVIDLLLSLGAKCSEHALVVAARAGHTNVIEALIGGGVGVDATGIDPLDLQSRTALEAAHLEGNYAVVDFLVQKGALFRDDDTLTSTSDRNMTAAGDDDENSVGDNGKSDEGGSDGVAINVAETTAMVDSCQIETRSLDNTISGTITRKRQNQFCGEEHKPRRIKWK